MSLSCKIAIPSVDALLTHCIPVMYPTNETLEREISYLLSNQSLSDSADIDPITVVSVDAGPFIPACMKLLKAGKLTGDRQRLSYHGRTHQHRR